MLFNHNKISYVEFAVSLHNGDEPAYFVPIAPEVKDMLNEMLRQTIIDMNKTEIVEEIEYGEVYQSRVHVRCASGDPTVARVVQLLNAKNLQSAATALNDPTKIDFYFARFKDDQNQQCVGVKTPNQFKAAIGKRIIRLFDDTLVVVKDNFFKLDNEFDFIVSKDYVDILSPTQFMRVARVEKVLSDKAPQHVNEIASIMPAVDFSSILDFVVTHSRAQKLVSSIRKRKNLMQVTIAEIQSACKLNNIPIVKNGKKIIPEPTHEIDFLELLDGRRYPYPLGKKDPDLFRALRRSKI